MHPAAHSEVLSPEAAAHVPHAGAHSTSPIESAGAVVATDDELCDFLLDAACLDRRILQQSLDKLHNEDVFMVSDLQLLDELGGLSRVFTPVTAKKVADALGRRAAAGAQQQQQGPSRRWSTSSSATSRRRTRAASRGSVVGWS